MSFPILCPHCKFSYGTLDTDAVYELMTDNSCKQCGRKFRVHVRHPQETCDTCGHHHECESEIEHAWTEPWCGKYSEHHYQPTLATNMEKCMKCFDIRRISPPSA